MNRRDFLQTTAAAASPAILYGVEPFHRNAHAFKGLSLTAYSMKRHMKWWWGKETKGVLDMLGFLDYCAGLGLEAVEITSYFFQDPLEQRYIHAIKRHAHLLGLDISGGAMGNNFAFPPDSPENLGHMAYFREWVDHFADMGATTVRVFAGRKLPVGLSDKEILSNIIANLATACEYAGKRGILLGLENHDFASNIDYCLKIVKSVDSDWLGIIWDSANLAPTFRPYIDLERIAPYAVTAQIKVMTKVAGKPVPADYARLLNILRRANYRGYIVFEYEEEEDPYTAIPPNLERLRALL
jgi:sugar phosphate isomerase/epimerase